MFKKNNTTYLLFSFYHIWLYQTLYFYTSCWWAAEWCVAERRVWAACALLLSGTSERFIDKMSLSRAIRLMVLSENSIHICKNLNFFKKKIYIYLNLHNFSDRFWQYCRMSVETFDLLQKVTTRLKKQRKAISVEQRLVLILR